MVSRGRIDGRRGSIALPSGERTAVGWVDWQEVQRGLCCSSPAAIAQWWPRVMWKTPATETAIRCVVVVAKRSSRRWPWWCAWTWSSHCWSIHPGLERWIMDRRSYHRWEMSDLAVDRPDIVRCTTGSQSWLCLTVVGWSPSTWQCLRHKYTAGSGDHLTCLVNRSRILGCRQHINGCPARA